MAALWLKAIPWATILRQAPTVLAAADALLANSRRRTAAAATDDQALRQRLDHLEELQRANADLVRQLADQVSALAVAAQVNAARVRLAVTLGVIGVSLALMACLLAWFR